MEHTSLVRCPCGCGEAVTLSTPGGFAGTTAEVTGCSARRAAGIVSVTMRKSAGLDLVPISRGPIRHRDGLVVFS